MLRVDQIETRTVGAEVEISAVIDGFRSGDRTRRLWFRFPDRFADGIAVSGNPFMVALMPVAARLRKVLQVDRPVSPMLLSNSRQIGRIWRNWYGLRLAIDPPGLEEGNGKTVPPGVGCFFSGGVDSFYTVLKNLERETGDGRITHLVHVRGFDIDLRNEPMYREVSRHLEEAAGQLGLPIIMASTNIREVSRGFTSWGRLQHGASLAAVGHCLSGLFRTMFLPATHTYEHVFPWGTHPLLDPLWSSGALVFISDGCEASRAQKIFLQIARSPVALQHLRVCYKKTGSGYNCGQCEKCLRTMVVLKVAGVLDRCSTFADSLDLDRVRNIRIKQRITESFAKDTLAELRERNEDPELQAAMEKILSRWTVSRIKFHIRDRFRT
jgi:hypothetical protein